MASVLIIEDDSFLADIYLTKFREAGFVVELAQDGKEGLRKTQDFQPDIILLDIVMPHMDGFEALHKLRTEQKNNACIILLTNLGQKEDQDRGTELGADGYLIKAHYTPTEVVAKVQEIFKEKASQ
jgi:DNA-binding response OmpR family regulator